MMQAGKIKGVYPMTAQSIVFDDGHVENFTNRTVVFCGDFLIAEGESEENPPTMYNTRYIREIRDVEEHKPQARISAW